MRFIAAAHPLRSDRLTAAAAPIVRSCRTCGRWWSSRPPAAGSSRTAIARFEQSRGVAAGEADAGLLAALAAETTRAFGHNRTADTRFVQRLLAIRGFGPGGIDDLVGPRTRAAITAFVRSQGNLPSDALDAGLLDTLLALDDNRAGSGARA
jgi:peptidoglycan hydrolase-like protein with peptidoglycan-binding domain